MGKLKQISIGSDFSGVGAFEQALIRLGIKYRNVFACDMDKYVRESYLANYDTPEDYPENVYDRKIPKKSLDIYMTSPPCQSFSIAGKRKGEGDDRGVLFYNSHEFIDKNRPRFFIFENVKGLLSDDKKDKKQKHGNTFNKWIQYLGGKSVNGAPVIFPYEKSVPYHIYFGVLNSKDYSVPQNRERVFIIGIRDDKDNHFAWPKKEHLKKRLKDVLEKDVDPKHFLSQSSISYLNQRKIDNQKAGRGFGAKITDENGLSSCIDARYGALRNSGETYIKVHELIETVRVRKHEVDIKGLQKLLKNHKNQTIKKIADSLNVNKTTVEHWFRTDDGFSIPDAEIWPELKKMLNITEDKFDKQITEFIEKPNEFEKSNRVYDSDGIAPTLTSSSADEKIISNQKIRRLTPRECFRLQDFPDTFKFVVSDTQLYRQAGNSITVAVLEKIIKKLNL